MSRGTLLTRNSSWDTGAATGTWRTIALTSLLLNDKSATSSGTAVRDPLVPQPRLHVRSHHALAPFLHTRQRTCQHTCARRVLTRVCIRACAHDYVQTPVPLWDSSSVPEPGGRAQASDGAGSKGREAMGRESLLSPLLDECCAQAGAANV